MFWGEISDVKNTLPEMPMDRMERMQKEFSLGLYEAEILTSELFLANFFEDTVQICNNAKLAANWLIGDFLGAFNESKLSPNDIKVTPEHLGEMIKLIDDKTISGKIAKQVFEEMWSSGKMPKDLVGELGLEQITDESAIKEIISKILSANQDKVAEYKGGKEKLYGFFVGQAMKATQGKASPEVVNKILKQELNS